MKKLITVIAAVFVGLSLNAASVSWNIDMYDVSGSSDTTAFTLYVFSAGDTASALASALNTGGVFNQDTYNSTLSSATKPQVVSMLMAGEKVLMMVLTVQSLF